MNFFCVSRKPSIVNLIFQIRIVTLIHGYDTLSSFSSLAAVLNTLITDIQKKSHDRVIYMNKRTQLDV